MPYDSSQNSCFAVDALMHTEASNSSSSSTHRWNGVNCKNHIADLNNSQSQQQGRCSPHSILLCEELVSIICVRDLQEAPTFPALYVTKKISPEIVKA